MPLDHAIGGRVGRATLEKCATRLRRRDIGSRHLSAISGAQVHLRAAPLSASFVMACVTTAEFFSLAVSSATVIWLCKLAGVVCATGTWVVACGVTVGAALLLQRQFSAFSLAVMRRLRTRLCRMMVANVVAGAAGAATLALVSSPAPAWRTWLPLWWAVSIALGSVAAVVSSRSVQRLYARGAFAENIAVVGTGAYALDFVRRLRNQSRDLINYVGTLDEDELHDGLSSTLAGDDGSGGQDGQRPFTRIDGVVLCVPLDQAARIARLRTGLRPLNCDIYVAGDFLDLTWSSAALDRLGALRVSRVESRPLNDRQLMQKAVFDRLGAALLLVALAPLLAVIALAIRLDSTGAVLFRQPRIGLGNRAFTMFKFRTMYRDQADLHGDRQTTRNDARVTRVGRFLRRTSLDELPQLLNVIAGDMSLVGPRPHAAATKAAGQYFHDAVADYGLRHRVKPGMTGWAQVNGWRGETSTLDQIEQRVAHDLHYIDHWSFLFDLRIMLLTLVKELNSKTAF